MKTVRQLAMLVRPLCACALAATLAGCSLPQPNVQVPTFYDFGPPRAYERSNPAIDGVLLVAHVRATAPLDDTGIIYRLLYENAARPQVYALSRWAEEPAELLTDRLRNRLAAMAQTVVAPGFGARSDYTLRVELEDFSQHFPARGESRVHLRARATLLGTDSRTVLAQRLFEFTREAEPNAPGAVKALTALTDEFMDALVLWTAQNARRAPREP